jgi:hypothetical protein
VDYALDLIQPGRVEVVIQFLSFRDTFEIHVAGDDTIRRGSGFTRWH